MADQLQDLIQQLAKDNPRFLEGLENAAKAGLSKDKLDMYALLIKNNEKFSFAELDKILTRHENSRLDINWNRNEFIYRIVVSKRKRMKEKGSEPEIKGTTDGSNTQPIDQTKATGT